MKYRIYENALYCGRTYIGVVRYIDYKDNGRHGYGISKVKNTLLLDEFQKEANRLYPNAENSYIEYLDRIYR